MLGDISLAPPLRRAGEGERAEESGDTIDTIYYMDGKQDAPDPWRRK